MRIDSETIPAADVLTDVVMVGYRPKAGSPEVNETVRVPATLFPASGWSFIGQLSANEDFLHIFTNAGAYKGSVALVNQGIDDLVL